MKKPSILLINNIYHNWLQSIYIKTQKHMPVFTNKRFVKDNQKNTFGFIANDSIAFSEETVLDQSIGDVNKKGTQIQFNLVAPQQNIIQNFAQWQRYRKYWWSSITTTPSLFIVNEINNEDETKEANIIAKFPWGQHTVETITTNFNNTNDSSELKCSLTLENAMIVLLLDGLNSTKKEFLRLHRHMAPYKISFALQTEETSTNDCLKRLAKLMYCRLKSKDISACVSDFTHTFEQQIIENLELGVPYTAILNENTLINGIFHLLNRNTMLKEEVHIADFDSYAVLLFKE